MWVRKTTYVCSDAIAFSILAISQILTLQTAHYFVVTFHHYRCLLCVAMQSLKIKPYAYSISPHTTTDRLLLSR